MFLIKRSNASLSERYFVKNQSNFLFVFLDKIVSNEVFFVDDVHFTPNGSKAVAKNLFKCIKR